MTFIELSIALAVLAVILIVALRMAIRNAVKNTKEELQNTNQQSQQEMLNQFYQQSSEYLVKLANDKLSAKQNEYSKEIEQKKEMIEQTVKTLQKDFTEYRQKLTELEKDRTQAYGALERNLKTQQGTIDTLRDTTTRLSNILSNNRLRGNWGERTVEDIMQRVGFVKGQDYTVQTHLPGSGKRPDFVIHLSNKKKVCIDVKFPLDNLKRFLEAKEDEEKKQYLAKFKTDIQAKVKDVASREYISAADNTLDFAIIFVPSEMVYSMINNHLADVIDDAFQKKIIFTSPFSFYALVRTISEANRNFHYEKNIRKIVQQIETIMKDYERFQKEFVDVGKRIDKARDAYDQIVQTRYNKLDKGFAMVKSYQMGPELPYEEDESDSPTEPGHSG